jgi:hypothetical protein
MVSFNEMRPPSFRTILMDLEHAARWARCLNANRRFTNAEIQTSPRAKSPEVRYYVTYQPSNERRQAAMLDHQQSARAQRADAQEFTFCHDGDHDFFHCLSHTSGQTYETTLNSCSCPDEQFRCSPNGLACKHRLALASHIRDQRTTEFKPVVARKPLSRDMKWAKDQELFASVFGP